MSTIRKTIRTTAIILGILFASASLWAIEGEGTMIFKYSSEETINLGVNRSLGDMVISSYRNRYFKGSTPNSEFTYLIVKKSGVDANSDTYHSFSKKTIDRVAASKLFGAVKRDTSDTDKAVTASYTGAYFGLLPLAGAKFIESVDRNVVNLDPGTGYDAVWDDIAIRPTDPSPGIPIDPNYDHVLVFIRAKSSTRKENIVQITVPKQSNGFGLEDTVYSKNQANNFAPDKTTVQLACLGFALSNIDSGTIDNFANGLSADTITALNSAWGDNATVQNANAYVRKTISELKTPELKSTFLSQLKQFRVWFYQGLGLQFGSSKNPILIGSPALARFYGEPQQSQNTNIYYKTYLAFLFFSKAPTLKGYFPGYADKQAKYLNEINTSVSILDSTVSVGGGTTSTTVAPNLAFNRLFAKTAIEYVTWGFSDSPEVWNTGASIPAKTTGLKNGNSSSDWFSASSPFYPRNVLGVLPVSGDLKQTDYNYNTLSGDRASIQIIPIDGGTNSINIDTLWFHDSPNILRPAVLSGPVATLSNAMDGDTATTSKIDAQSTLIIDFVTPKRVGTIMVLVDSTSSLDNMTFYNQSSSPITIASYCVVNPSPEQNDPILEIGKSPSILGGKKQCYFTFTSPIASQSIAIANTSGSEVKISEARIFSDFPLKYLLPLFSSPLNAVGSSKLTRETLAAKVSNSGLNIPTSKLYLPHFLYTRSAVNLFSFDPSNVLGFDVVVPAIGNSFEIEFLLNDKRILTNYLVGNSFNSVWKKVQDVTYDAPTLAIGGMSFFGSPLLYARNGIDIPRSYNDKYLQLRSLKNSISIIPRTEKDLLPGLKNLGLDQHYQYVDGGAYGQAVSSIAQNNPTNLPWVFGAVVNSSSGLISSANSPYSIDKLAGADSLGLLNGSLALTIQKTRERGDTNQQAVQGLFPTTVDTIAPDQSKTDLLIQFHSTFANGNSSPSLFPRRTYFPNATNPSFLTGNYRINEDDIEMNTVLVPDVSHIEVGDILVGKEDGETVVSIIVGFDWTDANKPVTGAKWRDFWSKIKIVSTRVGQRQAFVGYWGQEGASVFKGFTHSPEIYQVRRLVAWTNGLNPNLAVDLARMPDLPLSVAFTQIRDNANGWRQWIPNTGEPLYLGKIVANDEYTNALSFRNLPITLSAFDFGFNKGDANGNIQNNKSTDFSLIAVDGPLAEDGISVRIDPNGSVKKNGSDVGNLVVSFTQNGSQEIKIGQNYVKQLGSGAQIGTFSLSNGRFVYKNGAKQYEYFAILANSAGNAAAAPIAGDDVILRFTAGNKDIANFPTMDKEYALRVYDKKLLWRANLYIDQPEPGSTKDWNDLHPWIGDANNPNEWNRVYDGTQSNAFGQLTVGTGGQVVKYLDFTPLRSIPVGTESAPTGENVLKSTVAYSYPDHPTEGPADSKGDAGSMDSPFDFVWKIKQQQNTLFWNYNGIGNIKSPPSGISPGWAKTIAPSNKWAKYKSGTGTEAFIPSLGLYYTVRNPTSPFFQKWTNDEKNLLGTGEYNLPQTFEAGTDCVGFAQRAASYSGSTYQWRKLPKGIFEGGFANYSAALSQYTVSHLRQYVRGTDSTGRDIVNHNAGNVFSATEIEQLKKIVPGDIWVKYSNANTAQQTVEGVNGPTHIAIVAYVPVFIDGMTAKQFIDQTLLIEGEFSAKIQSVVKKLSVGMYNDSAVPRNTVIYPGFAAPDGVSLNCTSWAIRRLLN